MYNEPQTSSALPYPKIMCMLCNLCAACIDSAITQDVHFLWFIGNESID